MKGVKILLLLAIFLFITSVFVFSAQTEVRVIVSKANIRLKPTTQSEILGTAPLGGLYKVLRKEGNWYCIRFMSEQKVEVIGYLHQSVVEIFERREEEIPVVREQQTIISPEKTDRTEREIGEQIESTQAPGRDTKKRSALRSGLGLSFPSGDLSELFSLGIGLSAGNSFTLLSQPMFDIELLGTIEAHLFLRKSGYSDIHYTRFLLAGEGRFDFKINPIHVFVQGGPALYLDVIEIYYWWWKEEGSKLRFGGRIGGGIGFKDLEFGVFYYLVKDSMFGILGLVVVKW